jgi:hypothetical protein
MRLRNSPAGSRKEKPKSRKPEDRRRRRVKADGPRKKKKP